MQTQIPDWFTISQIRISKVLPPEDATVIKCSNCAKFHNVLIADNLWIPNWLLWEKLYETNCCLKWHHFVHQDFKNQKDCNIVCYNQIKIISIFVIIVAYWILTPSIKFNNFEWDMSCPSVSSLKGMRLTLTLL